MKNLWEFVNWMVNDVVDRDDDKLITEPDSTDKDKKDKTEQSVAGSVAGVTLPLGMSTSKNKKGSCCKKK